MRLSCCEGKAMKKKRLQSCAGCAMMDKTKRGGLNMVDEELLLAISNVMDAKISSLGKRMDARFESIERRMDVLEGQIGTLEQRMDAKIEAVRAEIQAVKVFQENVILPRLQNIESSYLSTYERYRDSADRMEGAYVDVDLLKKTVRKHSLELEEHAKILYKTDDRAVD